MADEGKWFLAATEVELEHIAESIIDNYVRIEIKNVIMKSKEDNWKHISFDYKDKEFK